MVIFGYVGHLVIGTGTALVVAHNPVAFMAVTIGSLLPDVDHPQSMLGRFNPFVKAMKHRGRCHTLLGIAILAAPFMYFGSSIYAMAFIGALSHLLGDKLLSWFPHHSKFSIKLW